VTERTGDLICGKPDVRLLLVQVSDVVADDRSSPTDKHTHKIAAHVSAYIHHVRTQLKQTIPKAIVHCLVGFAVPVSRDVPVTASL
jgi:hypothetical protein